MGEHVHSHSGGVSEVVKSGAKLGPRKQACFLKLFVIPLF